jgi:hypothetical protein
LENLALRQQLAVLARRRPQPRFSNGDRLLWISLRRLWSGWTRALILVQPDTVVRWHRAGFKLYWKWISRSRVRVGRKSTSKEIRELIFRIVAENPTWGAPRIHGELQMLGFDISEHLQLAVDTRRTPGAVLHDHAKDEFAQWLRCRFPAESHMSARDPLPVQLESGAMPANDGLWMHNDKNTFPIGPESPQQDPEQTVMGSKPRPRLPRRQDRKLLTECKVLQYQLTARSNTANQG